MYINVHTGPLSEEQEEILAQGESPSRWSGSCPPGRCPRPASGTIKRKTNGWVLPKGEGRVAYPDGKEDRLLPRGYPVSPRPPETPGLLHLSAAAGGVALRLWKDGGKK